MKKLNSFKDYDIYTINFLKMSHALKRNQTKMIYVWKEKKFKSSYLLNFLEKIMEFKM